MTPRNFIVSLTGNGVTNNPAKVVIRHGTVKTRSAFKWASLALAEWLVATSG